MVTHHSFKTVAPNLDESSGTRSRRVVQRSVSMRVHGGEVDSLRNLDDAVVGIVAGRGGHQRSSPRQQKTSALHATVMLVVSRRSLFRISGRLDVTRWVGGGWGVRGVVNSVNSLA